MLFKKKPKRERMPSPPWMKVIIVGFLVFAVIGNMHKGSSINKAIQQAQENLDPKQLVNWQDYKSKIFPGYGTTLHTHDIEDGKGPEAMCGQTVSIAYTAWVGDVKTKIVFDDQRTADHPLTFRIGDHKAMPALDLGATGMRVGGKRSVIAPMKMAYGLPEFAKPELGNDYKARDMVRFEMELLKLSPPLPGIQDVPFRIATIRNAQGAPALCGDTVKLGITVWAMDGGKLFSTRGKDPLSVTLGKSEAFLGLEQGALGMKPGDLRTLIVPPAYQKTLDGGKPAIDIPFPKNQTVLVDVEVQ
jgi:FKBP-type peptidyl-prolyl cis-trans isomerase